MSTEPLLLDYNAAAQMLSMSRQALADLVYDPKRSGPPTIKIGRRTFFSPDDLKAWIARHRIPANDPRPVTLPKKAVVEAAVAPGKRRRGRPTKADQLARAQHFEIRE